MGMYHYKIDIPEWQAWPLLDHIQPPSLTTSTGKVLFYNDETCLRPELVESYKKLGLEFRSLHIFITPPKPYYMTVHIDGADSGGDRSAINWVQCSSPWTMNWWQANKEPFIKVGESGDSSYVGFRAIECTLLERYMWGAGACLVRTDIPHNVTLDGRDHRICASIRFDDNDFDRICSILKNDCK
jgi:hypothetical protein